MPNPSFRFRSSSAAALALAVAAVSAFPQENVSPAAARHRPGSHAASAGAHPVPPAPRLTPLSPRDRAAQLLNRFTYGPRPGDVDRVLAQGDSAWLEQQLHPESIPDAALAKRLADYPTLSLEPQQALALLPDNGILRQISDGKLPMPTDPDLAAVYEVELLKYNRREALRKAEAQTTAAAGAGESSSAQPPSVQSASAQSATTQPPAMKSAVPAASSAAALPQGSASPPVPAASARTAPSGDSAEKPTFEEKTPEQRRAWQQQATRDAATILALPRDQRMPAILRLPVSQRAIVCTYIAGDQRKTLLADLTPREREFFYAMSNPPGNAQRLVAELSEATVLRDIVSERQLEAVMTDFWFNHFNIFAEKESDKWYTPTYVRDSIRPHALGHFRDLLVATATSPAMMVYLDNWLSVGPDSPAAGVTPRNPKAKKGSKGLNENYGREVMELHTLSVNGGYSQADVTALSEIFTGWTVDRPQLGGPFQFDQRRHEPGDKQWLGHTVHEGHNPDGSPNGMREGLEALDILARSPQTARFISTLLAERFVSDTPPPNLVQHLTETYLASDGDISALLRAIAASPEFGSAPFFHNKVKTPVEFVASAFRSTGTDPANPGALVGTLRSMGMPLYAAQPPTGYYLTAEQWMNSAALVDRIHFADDLTASHLPGQRFDSSGLLATALLSSPTLPLSAMDDTSRARKTSATDRVAPAKVRSTAAEITVSEPPPPPSQTSGPGLQVALYALEMQLFGQPAKAATDALLHRELSASTGPVSETLNLLDRLLLSAPDFQLK